MVAHCHDKTRIWFAYIHAAFDLGIYFFFLEPKLPEDWILGARILWAVFAVVITFKYTLITDALKLIRR